MAASAAASAKSSSSHGVRNRHRGRSRHLGKRDGARFAAAAAASLLLGWWVVKTSAVDALVRSSPAAAAAAAPDHPAVQLALAVEGVDLGMVEIDRDRRERAAAAFARAPLAEEPFLLAALAAISDGRSDQAEALLVETRRRNPRLRQARLFLIDRYLRDGRVAEAGVELATLRRLVPRVADALAPQLALMARDPRIGGQVIRVLGSDRDLQQAVLNHLASTAADPDLILRVAAAGPRTVSRNGLPWQQRLLDTLVERGEIERAVRLWRGFAGLPASADAKAVHDGRFQGLPGAAPFNWTIIESTAGTAELSAAPALQVDYFGRETADLVRQVMTLRPGRYRLQFRVEGNAKGDDSRVGWRVICAATNAQLAEVALRDVTAAPRTLAGEFTVPANCPAQSLRLTGTAGEFPGTQTAAISDLQILPAGRR
jgi:hypothetical protein